MTQAGQPTQFEQLMKNLKRQDTDLMDIQGKVVDANNRLEMLEKLVMQVIHMLGPRLDQDSLRAGVESEDLDFLDPEEGIWTVEEQAYSEEQVEAYIGEQRPEQEQPRTRVPYKTNDGKEDLVAWDSLDKDMQMVIEMARRGTDPWQLYESPSGQLRIAVSGEVAAAAASRKLGNRTGQ